MQKPFEEYNVINKFADNSENKTYSCWDLELRDLPPRSKLYSLAPMYAGTTRGECLLSYFARLAFEYLMSPKKFLEYVIDKSTLSPDLTKHLRLSRKLNCKSDQTQILIDILQELTQRKDIYYTTLLSYKGSFYSFNSIRRHKVWCSLCFADQIVAINLNYEKLVWTFNDSMMCYWHDIFMEKCCPNCDKRQGLNTQYFRPGYCSNCFKWLGDKEHLKACYKTQKIKGESKKKTEIEELGSLPSVLKVAQSKSTFRKNLTDCICELAFGSIVEFSYIVRIRRNKIRHLLNGETPALRFLINISRALDIPIIDLLTCSNLKLSDKKIQYKKSYQSNYLH